MFLAFLLSLVAGLSTLIGTIFLFFNKKKEDTVISSALSFSSGVMLSISIIELIPEGYSFIIQAYNQTLSIILILIFVVIGIILSILIDKIITIKKDNNELYKVGIISMLALIIHNIPEGIATFITTTTDLKLGLTLVIAITLHNIPEGISIALPIYYATSNKKQAFLYTFISGISEPFGALLTYIFLQKYITPTIIGILFCLIAGIMFYISIYELLPTSINYQKIKISVISFLLGIIFVIITMIIF